MAYLILPLVSGLVAQFLKIFINSGHKKIGFKNFIAYSGMPSGHSALVISLATVAFLKDGFVSPIFAICLIFAVVVVRDAVGLRRYLGQHGKTLNILVKDLKEDDFLDKNYPHLLEQIGHTPMQVFVGSLIGFFISFVGCFFI